MILSPFAAGCPHYAVPIVLIVMPKMPWGEKKSHFIIVIVIIIFRTPSCSSGRDIIQHSADSYCILKYLERCAFNMEMSRSYRNATRFILHFHIIIYNDNVKFVATMISIFKMGLFAIYAFIMHPNRSL